MMTARHTPEQESTVDEYGTDLAAVYHYARPFLTGVRDVPVLGSPEWCALPDDDRRKLAALAVAALSRIVTGPDPDADAADDERARIQKQTAYDLSTAIDWTRTGPRRAELERRRAQPGPLARPVDRDAAARWAATGSNYTKGEAA